MNSKKIFLATSGRSGTGFLYSCFKEFTDFECHHEESPILMGQLLVKANSVEFPNCKTLVNKSKSIAKRGNYIDTAHQFMKGFHLYCLEEMPDLNVIHMVRSPLSVMKSRLLRGSIPGKSVWVQPHGLKNQILKLKPKDWDGLSDLQKIGWDWLEHEKRY
jgi:hypothetical protein